MKWSDSGLGRQAGQTDTRTERVEKQEIKKEKNKEKTSADSVRTATNC